MATRSTLITARVGWLLSRARHRLGGRELTESLIIVDEDLPYQPEVMRSRALARWMPHPPGTWGPAQDAAIAHIGTCCASPDAPSCRWAPIPERDCHRLPRSPRRVLLCQHTRATCRAPGNEVDRR